MEVELMVTKCDDRQQGEYRAFCLWKVHWKVEFCKKKIQGGATTVPWTMPQGGTYQDPECFWDAAVLQFVAAAEKEKALRRGDISKQNLIQITPTVTTNPSSYSAKSSAITKQNLVRIIASVTTLSLRLLGWFKSSNILKQNLIQVTLLMTTNLSSYS